MANRDPAVEWQNKELTGLCSMCALKMGWVVRQRMRCLCLPCKKWLCLAPSHSRFILIEAQQAMHKAHTGVCLGVDPPPLQERIKELTDKFNVELDADRQKFELLLQEKNEQELEYEEKLKQVSGQVWIRRVWPCK